MIKFIDWMKLEEANLEKAKSTKVKLITRTPHPKEKVDKVNPGKTSLERKSAAPFKNKTDQLQLIPNKNNT